MWKEQIDSALIKFIQKHVSFSRDSGDKTVPVLVRNPEEFAKIEEYPTITICNLFDRFDPMRTFERESVVNRDFENNKMTLEEEAIPFQLFYQMDFWSLFKVDMNRMTKLWLSVAYKDFILPVLDEGGNARESLAVLKDPLTGADFLQADERIFRSTVTYKISAEIDENVQRIVDMSTVVNIEG